MDNLNEILKTISEIQKDITLVKIERKDIPEPNSYYWDKREQTHYTTVIKFKQ